MWSRYLLVLVLAGCFPSWAYSQSKTEHVGRINVA